MTSGFVSCFSMKVRKDSSSSMPMCTDESALSFYTATRWTCMDSPCEREWAREIGRRPSSERAAAEGAEDLLGEVLHELEHLLEACEFRAVQCSLV
jgi:hypothetical protein